MNPKRKVNNELLSALASMHEKDTEHKPLDFTYSQTEKIKDCKICGHIISLAVALENEFHAGIEEKEQKPAFQGATCGGCRYWEYSELNGEASGLCMGKPEPLRRYDNDIACMHFVPAESTKENTPPEKKGLVCPMCHAVLVPTRTQCGDPQDWLWSYGYTCKCNEEIRAKYYENQEVINDTEEM